jgi:hypothetical protein
LGSHRLLDNADACELIDVNLAALRCEVRAFVDEP